MTLENFKFISIKLDDNATLNYANLTLYNYGTKWKIGEPNNASNIFKTKEGNWIALPTKQIVLNNSGGSRIGELSEIIIATVQKCDSGSGYSDEMGLKFTWLIVG